MLSWRALQNESGRSVEVLVRRGGRQAKYQDLAAKLLMEKDMAQA